MGQRPEPRRQSFSRDSIAQHAVTASRVFLRLISSRRTVPTPDPPDREHGFSAYLGGQRRSGRLAGPLLPGHLMRDPQRILQLLVRRWLLWDRFRRPLA